MRINKSTDALVNLYTSAVSRAALALEDASRKLRAAGTHPLATRYAEEMNVAFEAFASACDDLRAIKGETITQEVATR